MRMSWGHLPAAGLEEWEGLPGVQAAGESAEQ